jgi:plasmid stabilization system protein ParE
VQVLERARDLRHSSGDRLDEAQTLRDLVRAHLAADQPDQAREYLRQAVGIFEDLGDETQAVAVRAEFPGISA